MREAYKEWAGDSGPNWILDLEGPDGNVFNLWGILQQFADLYGWEEDTYEGEMIEESKCGGHYDESIRHEYPYEGYDAVLDYCLYHLQGSPAAIDFRMYGHDVQQISDYHFAISQQGE